MRELGRLRRLPCEAGGGGGSSAETLYRAEVGSKKRSMPARPPLTALLCERRPPSRQPLHRPVLHARFPTAPRRPIAASLATMCALRARGVRRGLSPWRRRRAGTRPSRPPCLRRRATLCETGGTTRAAQEECPPAEARGAGGRG